MPSDGQLLEQLRSVYLFQSLSDRELKDVMKHSRQVVHEAGHDIVEEGRGTAGFHLILDGEATVTVHGVQRHRLRAGDYFGEISLLDGKPRSATVRAETPLRTLSVVAWDFQPLLDDHPKLAHRLLLGLCARLRAMEQEEPAMEDDVAGHLGGELGGTVYGDGTPVT